MRNLIILFAMAGVLSLIAANYYAGGNWQLSENKAAATEETAAIAEPSFDIEALKAKANGKTITPSVPEGAVDVKPVIYGSADAPIIIEEFASFTCDHCAFFHRDMLPKLKAALVDSGLAQLHVYSFVRDNTDVYATTLLQCQDSNKKRIQFNNALYNGQEQWTGAPDLQSALKTIATVGGMSADAFESCYNDEALFKKITDSRQWFDKQVGVSATPYFRIGSQVVKGAHGVDDFVAAIEKELAK